MPKLQLVELDDRFWVPEASPEQREVTIKYTPAFTKCTKTTLALSRTAPMPRSPRSQESLEQLNKVKAELLEALEKLDVTEKKRKQVATPLPLQKNSCVHHFCVLVRIHDEVWRTRPSSSPG